MNHKVVNFPLWNNEKKAATVGPRFADDGSKVRFVTRTRFVDVCLSLPL